MPNKAKLAKQAIKYGPVVYALAQKYGPQMIETFVRHKEPAAQYVADRRARTGTAARKRAIAHADTVIEGKLQPVFHQGQPYWVVFSRNEPVGVHPQTQVPFSELLLNADPAKRMAPEELRRTVHLPRAKARPKVRPTPPSTPSARPGSAASAQPGSAGAEPGRLEPGQGGSTKPEPGRSGPGQPGPGQG